MSHEYKSVPSELMCNGSPYLLSRLTLPYNYEFAKTNDVNIVLKKS